MAWSRVRSSTTQSASPRSEVVKAGWPTAQLAESAMTKTSAASTSRCSASSRARVGEPISSSPSTKTVTPTGGPAVEGAQGRQVDGQPALVVGGAAAEQPAVALGRGEGLAGPQRGSPSGWTSWWA